MDGCHFFLVGQLVAMIVWNRDIAFYKIDVVKCTPVEGTGNVQTGGRELSVDEYLRRLDKAEEMYESFRKSGIILASYVLLLKEFENDETVVYKFGPNENVMGRIELNKLTRKFSELEGIPNPSIPSKFYFDRAAQRLAVCLVREGGEFPERTAFES